MVEKIPPPPTLSREYQQLNRWLLEIQSILNSSGAIDPGSVGGLTALTAQVNAQALSIAANAAANAAAIAAANLNITTNTNSITALALRVTALEGRNQILNGAGVPAGALGNNGDLYINNTGGAGTRLYEKVAGAWIAVA